MPLRQETFICQFTRFFGDLMSAQADTAFLRIVAPSRFCLNQKLMAGRLVVSWGIARPYSFT